MITAFVKAVVQLSDPRLRRVILFGVAAAILSYVALVVLAWWAMSHIDWFHATWANTASRLLGDLLALVVPLLFFPALATTIMSVRLETVAEVVEDRYYPALSNARPQSWSELLWTTLRFLAATVAVNVVALPFYLLSPIFGLGVPVALLVNGYLLGREYFEIVAFRRLDPAQAGALFRAQRGRWWVAGIGISVLFSIPVVNLAGPVIATAFMLHLFQTLQPQDR
jgi:uncharacterized protein involved in cysteine biosynthesis